MYISFVIPVYNEAGNVKKLHQEILKAAKSLKKPFEIIFVNDGSEDNTLKELKSLSPITIVNLRRNYGQTAALEAGIRQAKGEYLVTLDGDGQNDPADMPAMLKKLLTGKLDVVCGWRKDRHDSFSKRFISQGARLLRNKFISDGVNDAGCTLRVYKKECFDNLHFHGEMHRFIPALLKWQGFKIGELPVNHRYRTVGQSKYTLSRTIKGFLDMINIWFWRKYQARPLHIFGTLGMLLISSSFALGVYLLILKFFFDYQLADKIWPLVAMTSFIAGVQFFVFGLLANLIIENRNSKSFYDIKSIKKINSRP